MSHALDRTFAALGDPTRLAIVQRLQGGEFPLTEIAQPFAMTLPAVRKHLTILEGAGLVSRRRDGRRRPCRLEPAPLRLAHDWLDGCRAIWEDRYARLDDLLGDGG